MTIKILSSVQTDGEMKNLIIENVDTLPAIADSPSGRVVSLNGVLYVSNGTEWVATGQGGGGFTPHTYDTWGKLFEDLHSHGGMLTWGNTQPYGHIPIGYYVFGPTSALVMFVNLPVPSISNDVCNVIAPMTININANSGASVNATKKQLEITISSTDQTLTGRIVTSTHVMDVSRVVLWY